MKSLTQRFFIARTKAGRPGCWYYETSDIRKAVKLSRRGFAVFDWLTSQYVDEMDSEPQSDAGIDF